MVSILEMKPLTPSVAKSYYSILPFRRDSTSNPLKAASKGKPECLINLGKSVVPDIFHFGKCSTNELFHQHGD